MFMALAKVHISSWHFHGIVCAEAIPIIHKNVTQMHVLQKLLFMDSFSVEMQGLQSLGTSANAHPKT
jgi:hypothetical protein